jgi:outer membrane lipoprotein-sorting protein
MKATVEPRTGVPRKIYYSGAKGSFTVIFEGYKLADEYPWPEKIKYRQKKGRISLTMNIRSRELDPELDDDIFIQAPPAGFTVTNPESYLQGGVK